MNSNLQELLWTQLSTSEVIHTIWSVTYSSDWSIHPIGLIHASELFLE